MTACTFIGTEDTIRTEVLEFAEKYKADEIMTTNYIFDNNKRLLSFKIIAKALLNS